MTEVQTQEAGPLGPCNAVKLAHVVEYEQWLLELCRVNRPQWMRAKYWMHVPLGFKWVWLCCVIHRA